MAKGKERIVVPVDVGSTQQAVELVSVLRDHVGMFKIGYELLLHEGTEVVKKVASLGVKIFLDTKLLDIPNTVSGAARGAVALGVAMFNVHASGGYHMMRAAVEAAEEEAHRRGVPRPAVLGVTVLTSIDEQVLNSEMRISGTVEEHVVHLASLAEKADLDGIIASPREIAPLRRVLSDTMMIVTPGIRPSWALANDQKRIMTPGEAIKNGASLIVVGRPITKPPAKIGSPADAAMRIAQEIDAAEMSWEVKQ